ATVMARSQADAVMSAGLFFGEDTTDSLNPVQIFKNPINHATAAASVLVYSANKAGFLPNENHTTVEEFEQEIRGRHSGVPHIEKLAFKLAGLVPLHQKDESLKNWMLSLVVVDKPQGSHTVRIQFVYIMLSIAFEHTSTGTKAYIPEQRVSVSFTNMQVNAAALSAYADHFADKIPIVDVEHMIALLTSPEPEIDSLRVWFSAQKRTPAF
ncbi:hypothetical protein BGZ81_002049, partial [Podila clonocystis]